MRSVRLGLAVGLAGLLCAPVLAHQDDAQPGKSRGEKLGRVQFKTSCTPEAQKQFERALAMLHSFFFPETVKAFTRDPADRSQLRHRVLGHRDQPAPEPAGRPVRRRDPEARARRGREGQGDRRQDPARARLAGGHRRSSTRTTTRSTRTRGRKNYEKAMEALAKKYPDDVEAKIFYALALNETFDHKTMDNLLKAIKILEPLDQQVPGSSGHDALPDPQLRLPADRASVASPPRTSTPRSRPAAPHAQHMPSHIYSMVGMWEESIASNLRSVAVANEYAVKAKLDGTLAGVPHAYDFMAVRLSPARPGRQGQGADRRERGHQEDDRRRASRATARAAVPARYMLERQDWQGAAQLQPLGTRFPAAEAITHFARAWARRAAATPAAAQADIEKLKELRAALEKANQSYWAEQVEIQILARAGLARACPGQQARTR